MTEPIQGTAGMRGEGGPGGRLVVLRGLMIKELRALSRDPQGLAALFLMPLLFIVVMSVALQNVFAPPRLPLHYAVLDDDRGAAGRSLLDQWARDHGPAQALPADWRAALQAGSLGYVLQVEPGFSARVAAVEADAGLAAPRVQLWLEAGASAATSLAAAATLERAVGQLRARLLVAQLDGSMVGAGGRTGVEGFVAVQRAGEASRLSAVQHNVPAWLVFGMFFVVAALGSLFVEERQGGTLARLRSLGVGTGTLLLSKWWPYLGVNLLQAALMLGAGVWLMPVFGLEGLSLQGVRMLDLLAVLVCIGAAAVGLGLWLATLMRTHAQAHAVGPLLNVVMGAVGGVMVPTSVMPAAMQSVARLSPMNWSLEALLGVLVRGTPLTALASQLLPLLAMALVSLAAAAWRLHRPVPA